MSFEPRDYLKHILVEADYLVDRSEGLTFETFVSDQTLRRAFVRSIEIIGFTTTLVSTLNWFGTSSATEWQRYEMIFVPFLRAEAA